MGSRRSGKVCGKGAINLLEPLCCRGKQAYRAVLSELRDHTEEKSHKEASVDTYQYETLSVYYTYWSAGLDRWSAGLYGPRSIWSAGLHGPPD